MLAFSISDTFDLTAIQLELQSTLEVVIASPPLVIMFLLLRIWPQDRASNYAAKEEAQRLWLYGPASHARLLCSTIVRLMIGRWSLQ